ncbi:putative intracellular septation protein A [Candidatus Filomicrobium marinum]|uniref:Inner membrane-spanning protein YciB n=2 Tax=Filomicrobium TaxID=119044 RepID=A0A0D6JBV4_9HYPH|nr:septation protein A [Filomicrobium sp.]CFX07465.1 putative intracellular septation protein A [Candidatus Filomicrobium marinum]CPR16610.1 putative intracellular septation protein A [Candidatus Filomicrobium marinum]
MTNSAAPDSRNNTKPVQSDAEPAVGGAQLGKMLLEVGPLGVFFFANSQGGIFWGTGCFMAATLVALSLSFIIYKKIPIMPLISGVFILVFGALTLWLHDDLFIKIKPTLVNTLFGSILAAGLFFNQYLLKYVFGEVFRLRDEGWKLLTIRWAMFFFLLAALNEIVWRNFSDEFWISFKLFGIMPLTLVFAMAQVGLLKKYDASPKTP